MLEVVFSESAGGAIAAAVAQTGRGRACSVGLIGRKPPSRIRFHLLCRQLMQTKRRCARFIPLQNTRQNIVCLPLYLSVGAIAEPALSDMRLSALEMLMQVYPGAAETARQMLETGRRALARIMTGVAEGEALRIFCSDNPDEACGLYFLAWQLCRAGHAQADVRLVTLPPFVREGDRTVTQHCCWGEISPRHWGALAQAVQAVSSERLRAMAKVWTKLQSENAPLRAVVNGRLISAPETLYDAFILHEIDAQPETFHQARVIGAVLGKYTPGISDAWLALRMQRMIDAGMLEACTQAGAQDPCYHRLLKKTHACGS